MAYAAKHLSLSMLEYLVHIDPDHPPDDLVIADADVPDNVPRLSLAIKQLPAGWRQTPAPAVLTAIGDEFIRAERAAVLTIPSVLAPSEFNWLINPRHPAFARIRVRSPQEFQYDSRLFD